MPESQFEAKAMPNKRRSPPPRPHVQRVTLTCADCAASRTVFYSQVYGKTPRYKFTEDGVYKCLACYNRSGARKGKRVSRNGTLVQHITLTCVCGNSRPVTPCQLEDFAHPYRCKPCRAGERMAKRACTPKKRIRRRKPTPKTLPDRLFRFTHVNLLATVPKINAAKKRVKPPPRVRQVLPAKVSVVCPKCNLSRIVRRASSYRQDYSKTCYHCSLATRRAPPRHPPVALTCGGCEAVKIRKWNREAEKSASDPNYRCVKCRNTFRSKERSGTWQGGISRLPYSADWTPDLKRTIRRRDNNKCRICGVGWRRLDIHHINYIKDDLTNTNLITLCRSCHSKTNVKREQWIEWFKTLIQHGWNDAPLPQSNSALKRSARSTCGELQTTEN